MNLIAPRHLRMWPIQLAEFTLALAVTAAVFTIAGGDWHRPIAAPRPLIVAGLALLGFGLITCLAEYECRTTERRAAARELTRPPKMTRGDTLTVGERAVLATAMQVYRAQLPPEHPQYENLREAVALLAGAIERGARVHGDTLAVYRHVLGTPALAARHIVAGIVRAHGPIHFHEIAARLREGTAERPPLMVSSTQLAMYLRDPDNPKVPAPWLAPRVQGEPYQHRENLTTSV